MKTKIIFTAFYLGLIFSSNAQSTEPVLIKIPKPTLSLGYGSTIPSSATKDAYVTTASGVNADISIPLASLRKGWGGTVKGGITLGINVGGQYNFIGSNDPSVSLPTAFAIAGQTSSSVAYKGTEPRNPSFNMGIGPQINFNLGNRFSVSPMVLAEYFSLTQKEISAVQTTQIGTTTKEYNLMTLPETKTTGFALTPKVRMKYMLTKSLSFFADGSYIVGPKTSTQTSSLVPSGNANEAGQYEQKQLDGGTILNGATKSSSYSALGFNVGLSYTFGGSKGGNSNPQPAKANIHTSRSNIKQQIDSNTTESPDETTNPEPAKANIHTSRSNIKNQ